jgi:NDP-sugar pyrophosphorylase family protein
MQCVILAGGLGTRMQERHPRVPKTLIEVAGAPFAHWQLTRLADQGLTHIVYSIGYLGDMVRAYVGDGRRWGVSVSYVEECNGLLGTGGAIRLAVDKGVLDEAFFVLYGDSYLESEMGPIERVFQAGRSPALMTVVRNDGRWDASNVVLDDGRVVRYEKGVADPPPEMCWIDYGLSVLRRELVVETVPPATRTELSAVQAELSRQGRLGGLEVTGRFYEIGSPSGLADLEAHLAHRVADSRSRVD